MYHMLITIVVFSMTLLHFRLSHAYKPLCQSKSTIWFPISTLRPQYRYVHHQMEADREMVCKCGHYCLYPVFVCTCPLWLTIKPRCSNRGVMSIQVSQQSHATNLSSPCFWVVQSPTGSNRFYRVPLFQGIYHAGNSCAFRLLYQCAVYVPSNIHAEEEETAEHRATMLAPKLNMMAVLIRVLWQPTIQMACG